MTDVITQVVVWLNAVASAIGKWTLAPVAWLPGWLSITVIAAATGVLLLVVFKHTSNQRAIKRVRDDINANLLALKLFKDSAGVAIRAQGQILNGAGRLFVLALVPMAIMAVPVMLVLGQLSLWYQQRPLAVGEEAVVTLKLSGAPGSAIPEAKLQSADVLQPIIGPVRIQSKRELCWKIRAKAPGYHRLRFAIDGQVVDKELAVGTGYMRASAQRPRWNWWDAFLYPYEAPFRTDSPLQSIEIEYPERSSWSSGTDSWVVYWFGVSFVAAFCCRRLLRVSI